MRRDHPDLDQRFATGDFTIPATWMEEHVYKYGAIYDTPELMKKATGNETQAYDFLNYLNSKYERLYSLGRGISVRSARAKASLFWPELPRP